MTRAAPVPRPASSPAGIVNRPDRSGPDRIIGYLALFAGLHALLLTSLHPGPDSDVWWHLRAGADLLSGRAGTFIEAWSFTAAGNPWVNHEWLAELILALLERTGGGALVVGLAAIMTLATGLLVLRAATRERLPLALVGAWLAVIPLVMGDRLVARPQLFTYLLLALTLERFGAARRHEASLWILPAIQLFWTNLHGPVIGLGVMTLLLVGGGGVGRTSRERWWVLGGVVLASMIHPAGPRALFDYLGHLAEGGLYRQMVQEWQPLLSSTQQLLPEKTATMVMALLTALAGITVFVRRRSLDRWGLAILLLGLAAGPFMAARNRDLLAVGALPTLALLLAPGFPPAPRFRVLVPTVGLAVAGAALFVLINGHGSYARLWPPRPALDTTGFPVDATDFLRREASAGGRRILNSYDFGGWLVHEMDPAWRIFVDGRYFIYGETVVAEYLSLRDAAPGTRERLDTRDVDWLFLRYPGSDGYQALAANARGWPEWALVHWDDQALVYAHRESVDPMWLRRHEYRVVDPTLAAMPDDTAWWREHHADIVSESWRAAVAAPRSARPWLMLALASERADRDQDAVAGYDRVLRLFPGHRIAREALELIRTRHGGMLPTATSDESLRNEYGPRR